MEYMEYETALVLGLGRSGCAAARLLAREGTGVTAVDMANGDEQKCSARELEDEGISVELGVETLDPKDYSVCVVSPGIPWNSQWMMQVRAAQVPILPELELGWKRSKSKVIAVTGSNGKSTLVKLCAEALEKAGQKALPCANYGPPLSELVLENITPQWLVCEVSSFQLETTADFRPDIGVLLNLGANHLDRHGTVDRYIECKRRMFLSMTEGDCAVVPAASAKRIGHVPRGVRSVTFGTEESCTYCYSDGVVQSRQSGSRADLSGTLFDSPSLGLSAAAACAVLEAAGLDIGSVADAAGSFEPLPHRMQDIGTCNGVRFIDDSKATNLAAVKAGIGAAGAGVRLVAGGQLKESDLSVLNESLRESVIKVYLIGEAADQLNSAWAELVPCEIAGDIETAVRHAADEAAEGETVLLSPGCASYDQFKSYADRGNRFRELVQLLNNC